MCVHIHINSSIYVFYWPLRDPKLTSQYVELWVLSAIYAFQTVRLTAETTMNPRRAKPFDPRFWSWNAAALRFFPIAEYPKPWTLALKLQAWPPHQSWNGWKELSYVDRFKVGWDLVLIRCLPLWMTQQVWWDIGCKIAEQAARAALEEWARRGHQLTSLLSLSRTGLRHKHFHLHLLFKSLVPLTARGRFLTEIFSQTYSTTGCI